MEQIKIKDLTFFYNKQEKPAIENLSFNRYYKERFLSYFVVNIFLSFK